MAGKSVAIVQSYILRGGRDHGDGHVTIAEEPYGVRNGIIMRKFDSEEEIHAAIGDYSPALQCHSLIHEMPS